MPITPEHVGRSYPPTAPYRISRAKIAEFAAALGGAEGGDPNPAYAGEAPVAPPTFAIVLGAQAWETLFGDQELGLALSRTMHADQRFDFQRPLREGDEVVAQLTIDKVRNRGAMDMVGVRVDVRTVAGEPVCTATSQLIHTRPEGGQE
ncbi:MULTISPECIES: FAS1-like dehydratase domain-containing protein [unclassified Luteococcus]|uniref:FAS1-like dehydratase domain-containing protein n=1 Tax=unclassified Luteococcus TaxID=2639923 RepID=UPI00313D3CF0